MEGSIFEYMKKFWHFVWYGDSMASWVVSIILAFIFVKFIIYPGLGLVFETSHPVVAVVSGSMEHKMVGNDGNYAICGKIFDKKEDVNFDLYWEICRDFYNGVNISKEQFNRFKFKNGFNTGDVMVIFGTKPKDIKIGDVIVFRSKKPDPIIHRVIGISNKEGRLAFKTKGDHNANSGSDENSIDENNVIGRAVLRVPFLGYVKITFVKLLNLIGIRG